MLLIIIFAFSTTTYALGEYTVLTELPGTTVNGPCPASGCTANFQSYLPGAFKLIIGLSAVLAFVVITYGGILYATSDALSGKETGREYVTNAVYGLLLVIGAWAILYTINPKMLEFDLNLPVPKLQKADSWTAKLSGPIKPGYDLSPTDLANDNTLRAALDAKGVKVNALPCAGGQTKLCTNVVGLPQNAISGVEALAAACAAANSSCKNNIVITGGTEGGHSSHGPGEAVMDLGKTAALDAYIKKNPIAATTKWGPVYEVKVGDKIVRFLDEGTDAPGSSGAHWHVVFP